LKKSLLILPLVLLASALALSACGGGSSSSSSSSSSSGGGEDAAIEGAIETSATSSDPSKCSEAQTQSFNETETGTTGKESLEACEEAAPGEEGALAESVTVSSIEIEGEEGAAAVAVEGGSLGGQTIAAGLQKEGEDWKVDSFFAFIKYDPASLAEGLEEALGEQEGVSPEVAACVGEGVEEMTEEEAELLVFEKENEGFEEIFAACNG
jgi:hypothetical protein